MKLLIFSDLHGDKAALARLMETEADYYFAAGDLCNWGRDIEKLGPVMQKRAERMYVIPGNHESEQYVEQFCRQFGFHNFHGQTMELEGYTVAGLGYSNPTPFDTPGEYTEQELAARLSKFACLDPLVLICHAPPVSTKLDKSGPNQHFGSQAVRDFIDRNQPAYFYCGHIHEAAGQQDTIGKTQGWNVGKRGQVLELNALVR